jgi:hypothetical protein
VTYSSTGISTPAILSFNIDGDGTSTESTIDLTNPPFSLDFKGNEPVGVARFTFQNNTGITATLSINKSLLTVTCNEPPAQGQSCSVSCVLAFNGV